MSLTIPHLKIGTAGCLPGRSVMPPLGSGHCSCERTSFRTGVAHFSWRLRFACLAVRGAMQAAILQQAVIAPVEILSPPPEQQWHSRRSRSSSSNLFAALVEAAVIETASRVVLPTFNECLKSRNHSQCVHRRLAPAHPASQSRA